MAKKGGAFMAPVQPDEVLGEIVGHKPLPRTEITKKLWTYIRKHGLQDSEDKRSINSGDDAAFKKFAGGKAQITMFEMAKHVSKHICK